MNNKHEKILEFIARGEQIAAVETMPAGRFDSRGRVLPAFTSGPLCDQWLNEILIYANNHLSEHTMHREIKNIHFFKDNKTTTFNDMMSCLRAIANDDELEPDKKLSANTVGEHRMAKKIFISHSSNDKKLVTDFVQFVQLGMNIPKQDIFCTSLSGAIKPGEHFIPDIKHNIINCKRVFFLLSPSYFQSIFCLAEMGAAWALNQNVVPIVVPPIDFAYLDNTPLKGMQGINIVSKDDLTILYDMLCQDGIIDYQNTNDFGAALDRFMDNNNSF